MKLRYPAAVLVVIATISGICYSGLSFLTSERDLEFWEDHPVLTTWRICLGWAWFLSALPLTGILVYRWFVKPSQNV